MKPHWLTFPFLACALWAQAPTSWTPELTLQVQTIGEVTPSPDGQLVAYTQTRAVMETEKSEMLTQVFLARSDGSRQVQLTRGDKSATSPFFSPDGRLVYFSSERSGKPNLWRIPVDGGEAEMLTDWKGSMGSYRLSPNGKWVAFTGAEPPADEEKQKKEKRDFRVVDADPTYHSLWAIPAEADAAGKRAPRKVAGAAYNITTFDWSPDSRHIAFEHQPMPGADYWTKADLSEVEVESGAVRSLVATGAAEANPRYSPDGRYLAYVRSSDPPRWARDERIVLLPRQGGAPRVLPASYDESFGLLGWSADSSRLFFTETKGATQVLYALPVDGPPNPLYQPVRGTLSGGNLNARGTHAGLVQESSTEAPEAFVLDLAGGAPVRVSRANLDLPKLPLGETRLVTWKAKDGLEIEGLLTYPAGYQAGRKCPLVLVIHGGPAGVFTDTFIARSGLYPMATFAARGYAVLRPNPRGSSGYGVKFRRANLNDWGGKDYEDLMAGVDHVISTGVADPERLAVMGWSYGGFMTSWVLTHTRRFKAAAVGAGVTNLWSFTGTADIPGFLPYYFSGNPWENFEAYLAHSPMSFVKGATTPTLILHGEADVRVPISQGYELYNALKQQGVTTKMVVYPRTPHGPREPKFLLDIMQRHLEWVEKYVR